MAELAIIIVNYNVGDLLRACLRSLIVSLTDASLAAEIIVVDNASTDHSVSMIEAEFPQVTLLKSTRNVGFAAGNNLALRHLGFDQPDVLTPNAALLLNPDTVVQSTAIAELLGVLERWSEVVVVGPQLRYGDDSLQSSRRRFPTRATLFWESTLLEQWWPRNPWAHRYHLDNLPADQPQTVDWLVGAALLVRGSAIQRAGLLDEGFFMYSEELEWQQRIRRTTGSAIMYWPQAIITHYEGKSSEQKLGQRLINFNRSKLRYTRLQFGRRSAWLLARFLWLTFSLQLGSEAAKWLLRHKRPLRAARIKQYLLVLRQLNDAA
ncbi:MAG: glycosyltransferase family 2 protein [Herpetosiphonaceae bacterium]|nr:glycosyltransferase family 2 protein [Herpetosiphonaceae bacterium]